MKHWRMGKIIIMAINRPRHNNLEWRLPLFHDADLNGRSMGSQKQPSGYKEGILHVSSGVILGKIQGLKVMIIILDVGPTRNFEPHAPENVDDFIHHRSDWVTVAMLQPASGKRNINSLPAQRFLFFSFPELFSADVDLLLKKFLRRIELFPNAGPLVFREVFQTT